jgi:hypothetical protein
MTQSEFTKWLERILGDTPIEELVDPEVLEHMDRVHLQGEQAAWTFAKEDAREPFEVTIRAMCKTMFAVGYDAGREQAKIDAWFGEGSGLSEADDNADGNGNADDEPPAPRGLLPS